jgi:hypothetical protein
LLKILLAEDRHIRPHLREQLADHGGDAAEEMRPETILKAGGGRTFRHDPAGEAVRVHRLDVRIPDQVDLSRRRALATSAFQVRGYEPKSSVGANCVGLTKIETTTFCARRLASRTSDTCPSWSAPMVGTSATAAFRVRKASTARRKAGTVRTTMGLRDIWPRSLAASDGVRGRRPRAFRRMR